MKMDNATMEAFTGYILCDDTLQYVLFYSYVVVT